MACSVRGRRQPGAAHAVAERYREQFDRGRVLLPRSARPGAHYPTTVDDHRSEDAVTAGHDPLRIGRVESR